MWFFNGAIEPRRVIPNCILNCLDSRGAFQQEYNIYGLLPGIMIVTILPPDKASLLSREYVEQDIIYFNVTEKNCSSCSNRM